jgi:hemoglobin
MFDRFGGAPWFGALVDRFYDAVETDEVLRPLYPDDLDPARLRLSSFLVQYRGGPAGYSAARGHPRLRMRHTRFAIGEAKQRACDDHMAAAVRAGSRHADDENGMLTYLAATAPGLIKQDSARGPAAAAGDPPHR